MEIQNNIKLADFSSYKIGGEARYFAVVKSIEDAGEAISFANKQNVRVFVLGDGTNILFPDEGFQGLIIKNEITGFEINDTKLSVKSGENLTGIVKLSLGNDLAGFEWAFGIPGTIGGATRGNAGAYGGEMKDSVNKVTSMNVRTGSLITRTKDECLFGYRDSIFKQKSDELIVEVEIELKKDKEGTAKETANRYMEKRLSKHPINKPNAGSVFKNVDARDLSEEEKKKHIIKNDPFPIIPVGSLIEGASMKGVCVGGACVSDSHANFIVNEDNATAKDILDLIQLIKEKVKQEYGFDIEPEIQILK